MTMRRLVAMIVLPGVLTFTAAAAAAPVSFPHGTVDNTWTTTQPGAATGFHYVARYHAAGDPATDPPYMRRMVT